MKKVKTKERMSVIEAVDILSSLSELREKISFSESGDPDSLHPERWLDEDRIVYNEEVVREAFTAVLGYFEEMYGKYQGDFTDLQVKKGLEAVVRIIWEAKENILRFTGLFQRGFSGKHLEEIPEYRALIEYLDGKILPGLVDFSKKKHAVLEEEEEFFEEGNFEDLEDIRNDVNYEHFYEKTENGKPFYDAKFLQRLQRLYEFEKSREGENSFLNKIRFLQAKDFQKRAIAALLGVDSVMRDFYKLAAKQKDNEWASCLSKALMSLMLAAMPPGEKGGLGEGVKTSFGYFSDFRGYLREAVRTKEYKTYCLSRSKGSKEYKFALLTDKLCSSYFLSIGLQKDFTSLLTGLSLETDKASSVSEFLASQDCIIREVLKKSPNGPVRKIVEAFLTGDLEEGWDPLAMGHAPFRLFRFSLKNKEIRWINMPVPVKRISRQGIKIAEEFSAFLDSICEVEKKTVFLMDFQDTTSFETHPVVSALVNLPSYQTSKMKIFRLAKQTDFYFQNQEYREDDKASVFFKQIKEQILIGGACGYAYPKEWSREALIEFIDAAVDCIHEVFFSRDTVLSQERRREFIDIFYTFFLLKTLQMTSPDYVIVLSKDGLDSSICSEAELFFSLKTWFFDKKLQKKDREFLLWLLYAPALFYRERAVRKEEIDRMLHCIKTLESGSEKHARVLEKHLIRIFGKHPFEDFRIDT